MYRTQEIMLQINPELSYNYNYNYAYNYANYAPMLKELPNMEYA